MTERTRMCFVDTETTTLDTDRAFPWEVAIIVAHADPVEKVLYVESRNLILIPVPRRFHQWIDPKALEVNGLRERHPEVLDFAKIKAPAIGEKLRQVHYFLQDSHMAGNVIDYDARVLNTAFDYAGLRLSPWHYHLVDVENVAAGRLGLQPPYKSTSLSEALGVALPTVAHTAMGDAEHAMNLWLRSMDYCLQEGLFPEVQEWVA